MMDELERIKRGLVEDCYEDFVGLWRLIRELEAVYPDHSDNEIREMTLELSHRLLLEEDVHPGQFHKAGEGWVFELWELTTNETLDRIRDEWKLLGRKPNIADIVWFTSLPAEYYQVVGGETEDS